MSLIEASNLIQCEQVLQIEKIKLIYSHRFQKLSNVLLKILYYLLALKGLAEQLWHVDQLYKNNNHYYFVNLQIGALPLSNCRELMYNLVEYKKIFFSFYSHHLKNKIINCLLI